MRKVLFVGAVIGFVLAMAGAASAHVEAEAEPAQTSAENATLTFTAEAESSTAGIVRLEIAPPYGFDSTGVTLANAPEGWTLSQTDLGFAFEGAALPAGEDLVAGAQVGTLPDETETEWKAIVTYSDGQVDRWIDERVDGEDEPQDPAALLTLERGAAPNTSSTSEASTTTTTAEAASSPTSATTTALADDEDDDDGGSGLLVAVIVIAAIAAVGAGTYAISRRRSN